MTFMPNTLDTSDRGMKKKAKLVSYVASSASWIAFSLSMMFMVDFSVWKLLSSRRVSASMYVRLDCTRGSNGLLSLLPPVPAATVSTSTSFM